ncbi:MAG: hypothetical protein ACE5EK_03235, partial [Nitrospinales bacterium]
TVSADIAEKVNLSSAPFPNGVDEFSEANVRFVEESSSQPRLIAESPVQLKCELNRCVALGKGAGVGTLVLGNVVEILLSKKLGDVDLQKGIPPEALSNIGRMGADHYARTTDIFQMARPILKK